MKLMTDWLEAIIENVSDNRQRFSMLVVVMIVLLIGAGSLYMLLNAPA